MTEPIQPAAGRRATRRAQIESDLLEVGRRHVADHGAAALSIRAVARDLGLVPSALFRYVSGRDELLTRLIVAAYTSLGEQVQAAHDAVPRERHGERWCALAHAVRDWGRSHPHEWALVFGSPVPHYAAPGERTTEPGTRVPRLLATIGADAAASGPQSPEPFSGATALAGPAIAHLRGPDPEFGSESLPALAFANGIAAWVLLVGGVSSEVFGHLGPHEHPERLFDYLVATGQALLFGR